KESAKPDNYELRVQLLGEETPLDKTLKISVLFLPKFFVPVGLETVKDVYNRRYFKRISCVFGDFVCIPKKDEKIQPNLFDPPTYYIMVDKVSTGLFQTFAGRTKILEKGEWKITADGKSINDPNKPRLPVLNVSAEEAYQFAINMFPGNGDLPTVVQWDK